MDGLQVNQGKCGGTCTVANVQSAIGEMNLVQVKIGRQRRDSWCNEMVTWVFNPIWFQGSTSVGSRISGLLDRLSTHRCMTGEIHLVQLMRGQCV